MRQLPGPAIHLDESGNTGEHLADPDQPVFILAAVHLDDETSTRLAAALAGDADEGHYVRLRRRQAGRDRVAAVLSDDALRPGETVRVSVIHKPTMIVAKFVDLMIEPAVADLGGDLYADAGHLMATDILLECGPTVCRSTWLALLDAFVAATRQPTVATTRELVECLAAAILESGDHPLGEVLSMGFAPPVSVLGRLVSGGVEQPDHLYPEVALACEQIYWWGKKLSAPIEVFYDENKVLGRWRERLLGMADLAGGVPYQITASRHVDALPLAGMAPARSHETAALQVADTLAGATAEVLRADARGGTPSTWVQRLREIGVADFVLHWVWTVPYMTDQHGSAFAE
jgi:hypothetical protein